MKIDIKTPSAGESVTEAEVHTMLVQEGSFVKEGQPVMELETEKATAEVYSPGSGSIHFIVKKGQIVKPGDLLGHIDTLATKPMEPLAPTEKPKLAEPVKVEKAPLTENIASTKSQEESPKVRISIEEAVKTQPPLPKKEEKKEATEINSSSQRKEKMSRLRKTIAHRLVEAKNQTAMLTTFNEVDMSAVMDIRKKEKDAFEKAFGVRLGFMSFFVKATCQALKEFPVLNASIEGDEIVYQNDVHMGIAIGTERGLVVPVIRQANKKTFAEIEQNIVDFAKKAKEGKLRISDLEGGTFTISNGGTYGSLLSTPILNMPQSGILGMHAIKERPIAVNGQVVIRPMMYLALSYDHRIVDGEGSIKFLMTIKEYLENPEKFFIME
ncbi:MAG: 2-oxoglutarate dehydrogenase complex dihydrolipoyllysine-residue succinyltransferase [Chlamydiae bacterium]|nr:2-oxoglutarate dehydrogenase complex dihydrolipoyllysine-residue succinyltransferase [Chlamydiota bacterium]